MTKPIAKDEADIAQEQEDFARQEALWRVAQPNRLQARGRCYNCSEATAGLFCDTGCRQDYERRTALEAKQHAHGQEEKRQVVREVLTLRKNRSPNEDRRYFSEALSERRERGRDEARQLDSRTERTNKWKD